MSKYWNNICDIQKKQTEKGIKKYGDILEKNPTNLNILESIEMMQEEAIDMLMYMELIKELIK